MNQVKTKKPVISIAKLGEPIYIKTSNFDMWDPYIHQMKPTYNRLNDPHLRDYYNRKDKLDILKNITKEITADNQVKCTYREYKTHQRYLQQETLIAARALIEMERARMRQFLEQRQEGEEMTLSDLREQMLDEYMEDLRPVMEAERMRWKGKDDLEDYTLELDLLSCKADKRTQLSRIQSEVQHEWNREKLLREKQERRERQRYATEQRKIAARKQQMLEQIKRAEEAALDKVNKKRNLPCRSNITTKSPDARHAAERRPMKPQVKAPEARRCWR